MNAVPDDSASQDRNWADIRSAWYRYQATRECDEMEILREFLGDTLAELEVQPNKLSSHAYARIFDTMCSIYPWNHRFGDIHKLYIPVMLSIGILAKRSGNEKSKSGVNVSTEYIRHMKKALLDVPCIPSYDKKGQNSILDIFKSELSPKHKLHLLKECVALNIWLIPEFANRIKILFPDSEHTRFEYIPWCHWDASVNKNMVRDFLPSLYPLLELILSDGDWMDKVAIDKALRNLAPTQKNKTKHTELELPVDFLLEP